MLAGTPASLGLDSSSDSFLLVSDRGCPSIHDELEKNGERKNLESMESDTIVPARSRSSELKKLFRDVRTDHHFHVFKVALFTRIIFMDV